MSSYFIYYTEASIVCVVIFAIMLVWDLLSVDKQEKQIKYDRTLIAFLLYFLSDGLWAAEPGSTGSPLTERTGTGTKT